MHKQIIHIAQTSTSWQTRYTFSGKEKDAETGYSYFGARYYDSEGSIWLSVDPMADKYPSMSAYMYCAGNPVMIIDPNGMNTIKKDESINDALKQDATAANTKKTSFTYTLDYKLNESNIPFVETFRHLKGTFCEVQNTGSASDYQQGDDGAGYKVTLKIPNVSPWTRDYPTYATATGTGDSPSNLTYTSDHQYANAFFAGMTAGALTGLATELVGAALAGKGFVKPAGWVSKTSGNKKGILYRDPYNKHNAVRVMNGDPKSGSFPYVKYMKNGKFYNVNGKVLSSGNIPAAHIPLSKFNINVMPKF